MATVSSEIKVADETWIATALLHHEHPERADFTIDEIVERARQEHMTADLRPGVRVHATLHAVANRAPNPGRYRMLTATGRSTRRLYRPGDPCHPDRSSSKSLPILEEIPTHYRYLLDWYADEYVMRYAKEDPLLALRGSGREVWADEHADEYVKRLREGWE